MVNSSVSCVLHHVAYVSVNLFLQVSWVASEQPDDPPQCWLDERTWVCMVNSRFSSFYTVFYSSGNQGINVYMLSIYSVYSAEVMEQLIQSSDLFVMQVEMDVYTGLKKVHLTMTPFYNLQKPTPYKSCSYKLLFFYFLPLQWMFLQLNPSWDGPIKQLLADADAWLCKRRTGTARPHLKNIYSFLSACLTCSKWLCSTDLCEKEPFLNTEEGSPFRSVFRHVRLQYIINDLASARILERDNILPSGKIWPNKKQKFYVIFESNITFILSQIG